MPPPYKLKRRQDAGLKHRWGSQQAGFCCGLTPAGHSVPAAPRSCPSLCTEQDSGFFFLFLSCPLWVKHFLHYWSYCFLLSSSWSRQCLSQAAVLSWACTNPESTKSCFCASHSPYCCLYLSMVCPFLSTVTFLPFSPLNGYSRPTLYLDFWPSLLISAAFLACPLE